MTPEEINAVYETLATQVEPQAAEYFNDQIVSRQQGIGPMAAAVAGSGNGVVDANLYTYNRLYAPRVQQMADSLIVQGKAGQLNQRLADDIAAARQAYQNAVMSGGSGGGSGGSGGGGSTIGDVTTTFDAPSDQDIESKIQDQGGLTQQKINAIRQGISAWNRMPEGGFIDGLVGWVEGRDSSRYRDQYTGLEDYLAKQWGVSSAQYNAYRSGNFSNPGGGDGLGGR